MPCRNVASPKLLSFAAVATTLLGLGADVDLYAAPTQPPTSDMVVRAAWRTAGLVHTRNRQRAARLAALLPQLSINAGVSRGDRLHWDLLATNQELNAGQSATLQIRVQLRWNLPQIVYHSQEAQLERLRLEFQLRRQRLALKVVRLHGALTLGERCEKSLTRTRCCGTWRQQEQILAQLTGYAFHWPLPASCVATAAPTKALASKAGRPSR